MRVKIPAEFSAVPGGNISALYAKEIVGAGLAFSKTCYQRSKLSLREFEGARARTAEINGCLLCQSFRAARDLPGYLGAAGGQADASVAARGPAPDEAFYLNVSNWRDYPGYSERERLAIAYAEGLGENPHGIAEDEDFWARAKSVFSDDEIVDMSYCIAGWMGLGRVTHALGLDGACAFVPSEEVRSAAE